MLFFLPGFVGLCITSFSGPSKLHPIRQGGEEDGGQRVSVDLQIFGPPSFALPSDSLSGF